MSNITPQALSKLAQYDTPTVCNVIELFEIRSRAVGFMDHTIRAAYPEMRPMVGIALTARFRSGTPKSAGGGYAKLADQIARMADLPGPAIVTFQDLDTPSVGATFGEVMCSTYQAFGAAGLITSGAGRDMEQVRELGFPVFTGSTICSHAYNQIFDLGATIEVGGLKVSTGDLLHGDANGVTNIPLEIAAEVADACEPFIAAEAHVIDYNKSGDAKSIAEFTARHRATLDGMERLRKELSRKGNE